MGAKQLCLGIYEIDEEATREAVEQYLYDAREYKVTEYIPLDPKVTPLYEPRYHGPTNAVGSQTERIAITNVDEQERRRRHIERVEEAVSRLGAQQQKLIRMRYLDDDNVMDIEVATALGYSTRHYRRIKSYAIYRLATALGLVVLREE
ncbi:MAG: hypothetical protein C6W55_10360 [Thermobacillus sp.]|uniref:ArpU family phage packaging/lysis transcriptional regulator n=1 Tax=Thermobacillus sp. TaxID=2108467 RepID=UPI000E394E81|nr:ArpU family phage packaging/lysis transcriptional regulator [Thermobacillus sp.]REK54726.1 MAG: hypothetical protein C6W55_10360 [Thermobacillus sp.]